MAPRSKARKKKTKAELEVERLAREEAERKAKEEEEQRLVEEQKRKEEELKRLQEQYAQFREEELHRLLQEEEGQVQERAERRMALAESIARQEEHQQWIKYSNPTDEPDVTSQQDVNTYISFLQECTITAFASVLKIASETLELTSKLEDACAILEAGSARGHTAIVCREHLQQLCAITLRQLDAATNEALETANQNLTDRNELMIELSSRNGLRLGIWGSYADPRPPRKSVQFEGGIIQIDIPRQVVQFVDNIVYRVVWMPVDTYGCVVNDSLFEEAEVRKAEYSSMILAGGSSDLFTHGMEKPDEQTLGQPAITLNESKPIGTEHVDAPIHIAIGGVIHFDMLEPARSSFIMRGRGWSIRERRMAPALRTKNYPSNTPCKFLLKLPPEVVLGDELRVAKWNPSGRYWHDEGISDVSFNPATRQVCAYVSTVGILALVADRTCSYPYKSWTLEPVRQLQQSSPTRDGFCVQLSAYHEQHARLTLETARLVLTIDIVADCAKLLSPSIPELNDLRDVSLPPALLLDKLRRRGILLIPSSQDISRMSTHGTVSRKHAQLELALCEDIARMASSFEFRCCSWNRQLSEAQATVLVRETGVYAGLGGLDFQDFECVLAECDDVSTSCARAPSVGRLPWPGVKYTVVHGNDGGRSQSYSALSRVGDVARTRMSEAMRRYSSPEALERVANCTVVFENTVLSLLAIIRLFSLG